MMISFIELYFIDNLKSAEKIYIALSVSEINYQTIANSQSFIN